MINVFEIAVEFYENPCWFEEKKNKAIIGQSSLSSKVKSESRQLKNLSRLIWDRPTLVEIGRDLDETGRDWSSICQQHIRRLPSTLSALVCKVETKVK